MATIQVCDYCKKVKKDFSPLKMDGKDFEICESCLKELIGVLESDLTNVNVSELHSEPEQQTESQPTIEKNKTSTKKTANKNQTKKKNTPKDDLDDPGALRAALGRSSMSRTECDECGAPVQDDDLGILTCTRKSCGKKVSR